MNNGYKILLVTFLSALVMSGVQLHNAEAQEGVKLGILKCRSLPNTRVQIFLRTSVRVSCTFTASRIQGGGSSGKTEKYKGEFGLLGIDLSKKEEQAMTFVIFGLAKNYKIGAHALAGDYRGVQATIGLGVGGGPNHLLGGLKDSFSLAPSLETHKGIGVTLGATRLSLEPAK